MRIVVLYSPLDFYYSYFLLYRWETNLYLFFFFHIPFLGFFKLLHFYCVVVVQADKKINRLNSCRLADFYPNSDIHMYIRIAYYIWYVAYAEVEAFWKFTNFKLFDFVQTALKFAQKWIFQGWPSVQQKKKSELKL